MIMNQYHEFVLTRGDFDERIFLNAEADHEIGTPVKAGLLLLSKFFINNYLIKYSLYHILITWKPLPKDSPKSIFW